MKEDSCGFTLIELMIVTAILGILASVLLSGTGGGVGLYGYMKAKDVSGQLESVTSAMPDGAIVQSGATPVFQASVLLKQLDGSLLSFSTDDRQWASLIGERAKGKCVDVRVFPYAPWELSKAGTFYGGRILSVKECGKL
jgi:prepilin-type N-terminal cleavage/methylation domain-containing protein